MRRVRNPTLNPNLALTLIPNPNLHLNLTLCLEYQDAAVESLRLELLVQLSLVRFVATVDQEVKAVAPKRLSLRQGLG